MLNRYLLLIKRHMHEQCLTIFMQILLKNTWETSMVVMVTWCNVCPHDNFSSMDVTPTGWFLCLQSYIMLKFKAQRSFNKHDRGIQDFSISTV